MEQTLVQCPLTRAFNRRGFDEHLRKIYNNRHHPRINNNVVLAAIDADKFKSVNDTYGHAAGDTVLIDTVNIMFDRVRPHNASVYRPGGDEFMILFYNTDFGVVQDVLEEIRVSVEENTYGSYPNRYGITLSIGLTKLEEQDTIKRLVAKGDLAAYKAKEDGRNRIILYSGALDVDGYLLKQGEMTAAGAAH